MLKLSVLGVALIALAAWTEGNTGCRNGMVCMESFTYTVTNHLIWPYFNNSIAFKIDGNKPVIHYMQQACEMEPKQFINFTATYYHQYGYYIDAINGIRDNYYNNGTYWEFWNATTALNVGVSYYIPSPGDRVLLKFTVDSSKQSTKRHYKRTANGRLS
ncbi:cobalamin binding intrinsic factor-like [Mercenaria mercenaria]|uniref:cobalamin binding intrinsic factor-like n=1 Tax=Mercenaria mercenaria TaxID=6596 RepID=UPI00234E430F|nr:cobalamin binding intrinsic factor-like [Mercenaria mercenaria]